MVHVFLGIISLKLILLDPSSLWSSYRLAARSWRQKTRSSPQGQGGVPVFSGKLLAAAGRIGTLVVMSLPPIRIVNSHFLSLRNLIKFLKALEAYWQIFIVVL